MLFFLFLSLFSPSYSQINLVRNGGFEQYSSCPNNYDQIRRANFWQPIDTLSSDPICSPEYCNACSDPVTSGVNVPWGSFYYHYARSGNGMMELLVYYDSSDIGQLSPLNYAQGKLHTRLTNGVNYCVTFYVTLCQASQYAIDHISAYIDNGGIDMGQDSLGCARPQSRINPQIVGTSIINDTINWVKIQSSFVASGTEKFITIGNFSDNSHTDTIQLHPATATIVSFYLLDDVSVIESSAIADAGGDAVTGVGVKHHIGTYEEGMPCTWYTYGDTTPIGYGGGIDITPTATGVYQYVVMLDLCGHVTYDTMTLTVWPAEVANWHHSTATVTLYPNPATSTITIEHAPNCEASFYDVTGRVLLQATITNDKQSVDISKLPGGIYIVQITDATTGAKVARKLLKE